MPKMSTAEEHTSDREPFSEHGEEALKQMELLMASRERLLDLARRIQFEEVEYDAIERQLTGHVLLVPDHEHRRLMREISRTVVTTLRKLREQ